MSESTVLVSFCVIFFLIMLIILLNKYCIPIIEGLLFMPFKEITIYKIRSAAIILISSGYGWAGGHYIPSNSSAVAYLFQFIVISFLVIFSINYLATDKKVKSHWSVKGLSIFSILSLLANIFNVIHGAYNSDISSYGSHNSFADLVPIALLVIGTSLWLITLIPKIKPTSK